MRLLLSAFRRLTPEWITPSSGVAAFPSTIAAVFSSRRHYIPKIFLRHDIMKSILRRFLDAKGVPQDAIETVVATKHYYAFPTSEFGEFERVVLWWSTIGLHDGNDIGCVLRRLPNILWTDINLLESKMHWFLVELKFKRHEIGALLTCNPNLLFHHAEVLGHFLQLLEAAGLQRLEIQQLIREDATMLEYCENVEELASLMLWLTATLGIKATDFGDMVTRVPQLLNPVYHGELPHIYEYLYRMGLQTEQIAAIFFRNPRILLKKRIHVQSFFYSMRAHLQLRKRVSTEMALRYPRLLSLDCGRVEERVAFLADHVGMESNQMCSFVQQHPGFLIEDMAKTILPRFLFLKSVMNVPLSDIAAHPVCLTRKLDLLMRRFGFVKRRASPHTKRSLLEIVGSSDVSFVKSLGKSMAEYRRFLKKWQRPEKWISALETAMLQTLDGAYEGGESD